MADSELTNGTTQTFVPFAFAREQAMAIARDRISHLNDEAKAAAIELIENTLQLWKLEQASADGTIAIQPAPFGLLGDRYPPEVGTTMADLVSAPTPKIVPITKLRPESCAGPFVRCRADLWLRLWSEKDTRVMKVDEVLFLDVVMALLVERDGATMPVESIASALRYIWIATWTALLVYSDAVKEASPEITKARAQRTKQLADLEIARAITSSRKRAKARELAANAKRMAIDLFVSDISQTNDEVISRLIRYDDFCRLSRRGLRDRIKGAQTEARIILARRPPK